MATLAFDQALETYDVAYQLSPTGCVMLRYYFDIDDGTLIRDVVGRAIEGGDILRAEALQVAAELMVAEAKEAKETALRLNVRNEAGEQCLVIRLVCQVE